MAPPREPARRRSAPHRSPWGDAYSPAGAKRQDPPGRTGRLVVGPPAARRSAAAPGRHLGALPGPRTGRPPALLARKPADDPLGVGRGARRLRRPPDRGPRVAP